MSVMTGAGNREMTGTLSNFKEKIVIDRRFFLAAGASVVATVGLPLSETRAFLPALLALAGRAAVGFVGRTVARAGVRGALTQGARAASRRGAQRMAAAGYNNTRSRFAGRIRSEAVGWAGEEFALQLTTQFFDARNPNVVGRPYYYACAASDCCSSRPQGYGPNAQRHFEGGYSPLDGQVVLLQEANVLGLDRVTRDFQRVYSWSPQRLVASFYPIGYIDRVINTHGNIRYQMLRYLTIAGSVTTYEEMNYNMYSGHLGNINMEIDAYGRYHTYGLNIEVYA